MTDILLTPADHTTAPSRQLFESMTHPLQGRGLLVKRMLDVVLAASALVVLAPLIAFVLLAVRLESPGSVFFRQERVGRNNRRFWMYKVRSMRADADEEAHRAYAAKLITGEAEADAGVFKVIGDPRITRVGRVIRKYSIDELPQLWNVLKGDMSLVGPRPPIPYEVELYDERARRRLQVDPGMTGLWQVSGRSHLTFRDMIDLDLAYADGWHLGRDLLILARTPIAALTARGAA